MTIAFNCCKSLNIDTNRIDYSKIDNSLKQQQCFVSNSEFPSGYQSEYIQFSFNGNFPGPNGKGVQQLSYFEKGFIDMDFIDEQLFVDYFFDDGHTQSLGKLWGFGGNSTQYIGVNVNGTEYCFEQPLMFNVPTFKGLTYIGDYEIGSIQCDVFEGTSPVSGNFTKQILFVDKSDCSFISSNGENINTPISGYTVMNLYKFQSSADPSYFQLPTICLNPLSTSQSSLLKNHQIKKLIQNLPKIIEHYPF
ncbi:hypothetical protein RB653_005798 [Dictyostelium firmibasis]|uniref:Uncharacterized protein n=1 Tax=Dictyostelium firmibasis TaxID=79012 RepID=A0AAN7UDA7_9MYCE